MINMLKLFSRAAALGILLAIVIPAQADDMQDANLLFKQGRYAQALEKVNAFLANKPKDAQARFLQGLIFTEQGNTADAIKAFTGLTEDYPELPEPYNNVAVLYASQGQYEKAKSALEMAIRTHPNYATAQENLGDIYAKMAAQSYERALQLDKNNASAKAKLAQVNNLLSKNVRAPAKPAATPAAETAQAANAPVAASAPAAATSAPAAATPPAPAASGVAASSTDPGTEVLQATNDWAAAWSAKDSDKYLAFYAKEFKAPGSESRSAWEAQRKKHIAKSVSINVEVLDAKVKLDDETHASVSFRQVYRDSHLKSSSNKTLRWVKVDGQWLIAEERSAK